MKYEFEMKEPTGCDKCPFCNKGDDFYDLKTENPTRTYCAFPVQNNNARTVYLNWPYNVVPTYCPLKAAKCDAKCDNLPKQIHEEMGVHKGWYAAAHKQRIDSLEGFINHLMNDYIHDYGTVCHAIAASMMAAFYAADETEHGGITGFQAGEVMWEVIKHMNYPDNKTGLRIINYDNMLFPQYAYKFTERKISKDMFEALQKEAAERLKTERDHAHPKVIAHWQSIVDGKVPFGYEIEKGPEEERIAEEMTSEEQALITPKMEE